MKVELKDVLRRGVGLAECEELLLRYSQQVLVLISHVSLHLLAHIHAR